MNKENNFLDIASINFGNVRFLIKQTPKVGEYFTKNFSESELNKLMPSARTWYQKVLSLLGLDHKKEAEVESVIYSVISWDKNRVYVDNEKEVKEFKEFIESPLVLKDDKEEKDKKQIIKFALRKNE